MKEPLSERSTSRKRGQKHFKLFAIFDFAYPSNSLQIMSNSKKDSANSPLETVVKQWEPIGKIIGFALVILSTGFGAGVYYQSNKCELEKIHLEQDCITQRQRIQDELNEVKNAYSQKSIDNLNDALKQLQQAKK